MVTVENINLTTLTDRELEIVGTDRAAAASALIGTPGFLPAMDRYNDIGVEIDRRITILRHREAEMRAMIAARSIQ